MILETLFSITLLISGGHLVSTNFKLHHYNDSDYKEIFYLKNKKSITKHCTRHSVLEDINKRRRHGPHGGQETIYKVTKNYEEEILEETVKKQKS